MVDLNYSTSRPAMKPQHKNHKVFVRVNWSNILTSQLQCDDQAGYPAAMYQQDLGHIKTSGIG